MTLNDDFALKSGPCSASNGLAFMAFGENCSEICRATHILSAAKNVAQLGIVLVICVIGLFTGIPQRGSVKPVNCIYSCTLTVLTHAAH